MGDITRTIIIPSYNEGAIIGETLKKTKKYLEEMDWEATTEVVVVTADCTDNTIETVANHMKLFKHAQHIKPGPKVGKGRDVKSGMKAAKGKYIVFTDADLATPLHHLAAAFSILEQHKGFVIGVRNINNMHKNLARRFGSQMANLLIRASIDMSVKDSQCGFKGFDADTKELFLSKSVINGWGFDFEFIKIAKMYKKKITVLPIDDWHDPKESAGLVGESQMSAMINTLKELYTVKKNQLLNRYK